MGESSEINVYHNKDIIDRLERLETWWKFLPDPAMYIDFIEKYNEIKDTLNHYLRKDNDDTVSAVTTFQEMPQVPDTGIDPNDIVKLQYLNNKLENYLHRYHSETISGLYTFEVMPNVPDWRMGGNENDLVKKKYLDEAIQNCVKNNEPQTLNNDFTFNGLVLYHDPTNDNEPALYKQIKKLEEDKLTKTYTEETQEVKPKVDFKRNVKFSSTVDFEVPIEGIYFHNRLPTYDDGQVISEFLTKKIWNEERYTLIQLPELQGGVLPNPTKNQQLVHKKYVDEQISQHVLPSDVARKSIQNMFTDTNLFSAHVYLYNITSIMSRGSGEYGELRQAGILSPSASHEYIFPDPQTYSDGIDAYSDYINEHYYRTHTVLKESDELQNIYSEINFNENIYLRGQEVEFLTAEHVSLLNTLKNMLVFDYQLRFDDTTIITDLSPVRNLYRTHAINRAFSNTNLRQGYTGGISASVLGGLYRMDEAYLPEYEFLGVLQEIHDDSTTNQYEDTIHLMTYSLTQERSDTTPPMFNYDVGMWISGVGCTALWDSAREKLNSVETVLGYVKPEQYGNVPDTYLNIQPISSKVTCTPYDTIYTSTVLYSQDALWEDDHIVSGTSVRKYGLLAQGSTQHPQKTLAYSDLNLLFGWLNWVANNKSIYYEGSGITQGNDDVIFPPSSPDEQIFKITKRDGYINWISSALYSEIPENDTRLTGYHSISSYDLTHNKLYETITSSYLDINHSLNEYELITPERSDHEKWYTSKVTGFNSSITFNHKDSLSQQRFVTSLKDKIGYHAGLDDSISVYSRYLLQSSYTETHNCTDKNEIALEDTIEFGHYSSTLMYPKILYFNTLQTKFSTNSSDPREHLFLPRLAFSGDLATYKGGLSNPAYSLIRWVGYPATLYSQHTNADFSGLYFTNFVNHYEGESSHFYTLYNYDPRITYASHTQYVVSERKFIYSLLPDPSNSNIPILKAEVTAPRADEPATEAILSLNTKSIYAPYLTNNIEEVDNTELVNGYIVRQVNSLANGAHTRIYELQNELEQNYTRLTKEGGVSRLPQPGTIQLQNDGRTYPNLSLYSENWVPGSSPMGAIAEINVTGERAYPYSKALFELTVKDTSDTTSNNHTTLVISGARKYYGEDPSGYVAFIDNFNNTHLIAGEDTLDAIKIENTSTSPSETGLYPVITYKGGTGGFVGKLELRNQNKVPVCYINFTGQSH